MKLKIRMYHGTDETTWETIQEEGFHKGCFSEDLPYAYGYAMQKSKYFGIVISTKISHDMLFLDWVSYFYGRHIVRPIYGLLTKLGVSFQSYPFGAGFNCMEEEVRFTSKKDVAKWSVACRCV